MSRSRVSFANGSKDACGTQLYIIPQIRVSTNQFIYIQQENLARAKFSLHTILITNLFQPFEHHIYDTLMVYFFQGVMIDKDPLFRELIERTNNTVGC